MAHAADHFALVVESRERLGVLLADALVSRGYVVHTSPDAEAAAGLALQINFGVIVVGPLELAKSAPAVRTLLRQPGLKRAVVFHDDALHCDVSGIKPDLLEAVSAETDLASVLRLLVPSADAVKNGQRPEPRA